MIFVQYRSPSESTMSILNVIYEYQPFILKFSWSRVDAKLSVWTRRAIDDGTITEFW